MMKFNFNCIAVIPPRLDWCCSKFPPIYRQHQSFRKPKLVTNLSKQDGLPNGPKVGCLLLGETLCEQRVVAMSFKTRSRQVE